MSLSEWPHGRATTPDLRVDNRDSMPHDVRMTVRDADGGTVLDREFAVSRGANTAYRHVFEGEGTYEVAVSLRYGPTREVTHDGGPLYVGLDGDRGIVARPGRERNV